MHPITSLPFGILLLLTITTSSEALDISEACPNSSVYTPFKKWPQELLLVPGISENLACWYWAECVIEHANEVRKQQFAATSLVMGLVPLILKEIAWPDRKLVHVPASLNMGIEILVRALGLIPVVKADAKLVRLSKQKMKPGVVMLLLLTFSLLIAYGALVVMEIFSKRSSLGCPYPLFVFTWFIFALIPASVETCALRLVSSRTHGSEPVASADPDDTVDFTPVPLLGGEKQWTIQLVWSIYYAAGTLIYSSIMAVTVIELVVWVIISCFVVGTSKLLAYRLCGNWQ